MLFRSNSDIIRVDDLDISYNNTYYSHYKMKILFNRRTTISNIKNQKIVIVFPLNDSIIWTGTKSAFVFDKQINELSNLIGETTSLETEYILYKYPAMFLICKKPFYGFYVYNENNITNYINNFTLNNYTINVAGLSLNGCTMTDYLRSEEHTSEL